MNAARQSLTTATNLQYDEVISFISSDYFFALAPVMRPLLELAGFFACRRASLPK
jgi:hypothetical protein